jgi:Rps23 Pro-64 3,4-dihydroxylase Tpa1-like proline 4-hydroxylase
MSDCTINKNHITHPFFYIDDWYTEEEENNVWRELDFYTEKDKLEHAKHGPVAKENDGTVKADNYRVYLDQIFSKEGRKISSILNYMEKQKEERFHRLVESCLVPGPGKNFASTNNDRTMVSYYQDNGYYKEHIDTFQFTCLIWFAKQPQQFTGGDLLITEVGERIPFKHNRMVFFPSYYSHMVEPISMSATKELGYGRYVITHFYFYAP